jgi:uncharacterized protein
MDFSNDFAVAQPIDQVWETMTNLERILPLVPYTTVLEGSGSNVRAQIKVRFGSVSMTYLGSAEIIERDDRNHRAVMSATARQVGGRSCVNARVEIQLTASGDHTTGTIVSMINVPALGGQTGMATINRTTEAMIAAFAQNLATMHDPVLAA